MIAYACAFAALLIFCVAVSVVDYRTRRIPNSLTIGIALCGLALLGSDFLCEDSPAERLVWSIGSLAVLSCFEAIWRACRGSHGMGAGDIKLISAFSLVVGQSVLVVIFLACVFALCAQLAVKAVCHTSSRRFAFGPYLCASLLFTIVTTRLLHAFLT
jgi:prepilin signal peptidase PulO-like enzyme (type II secretory pathway)